MRRLITLLTSPLSCKQTWELPDMIVRNYNYFFRTTCSIPHFKALFSATENIPPIKRIPNLSYFTKLINNEKDFVLPSGILYSCLYSYCTKYNELPYFHVRTGRTFYRGRRQYAGLGGTGIALRGNNFLNNANPASLTELTEQRFQIDAGIMGAYQIYSQRGASNRSVTGNLNNLSIGCRIMPRWVWSNFHGSRQQCGICHHAG